MLVGRAFGSTIDCRLNQSNNHFYRYQKNKRSFHVAFSENQNGKNVECSDTEQIRDQIMSSVHCRSTIAGRLIRVVTDIGDMTGKDLIQLMKMLEGYPSYITAYRATPPVQAVKNEGDEKVEDEEEDEDEEDLVEHAAQNLANDKERGSAALNDLVNTLIYEAMDKANNNHNVNRQDNNLHNNPTTDINNTALALGDRGLAVSGSTVHHSKSSFQSSSSNNQPSAISEAVKQCTT